MLFFLFKVLLTIVCVFLGMFLLILITPVHLRFRGDLEEDKKEITAGVALYFGLLAMDVYTELEKVNFILIIFGIRIGVCQKPVRDFWKKPKKKRHKREEKIEKKSGTRLGAVDWIKIGKNIFPRLLRPIRFKRFEADLRVGFGNPATTGLFYSGYSIFKYSLHKLKNVTIMADFGKKGVFGKIDIDGFIYLIQYIPTLIFTYKLYCQHMRVKKGGKDG
ncbi:MAG: hypothetical protein DRP96_00810 [Candidatus Neomarinimicrobiota bacterium]|nr:MAG: hypothetical protein DRP96_00810 [Candidatus Neomarinimicrobiota bacterium]